MFYILIGDLGAVKLAIEFGADVNAHRKDSDSPLMIAVESDHKLILKELLEVGADPCQTNEADYTPLHYAAWYKHTFALEQLLKHSKVKVDHDMKTTDKNTPLALACHGNHSEGVKMLLPLGCDVNNMDKDNDTPLLYAVYNGMTDTVKLLLQYGADPNLANKVDTTAVWNAVYQNHKDILKILLSYNVVMETASIGINQHAVTNLPVPLFGDPLTPVGVCVRLGHTEIMCLLLAAGYDLTNEWPLIKMSLTGHANEQMIMTHAVLARFASRPPRLLNICRNFLRKYFNTKLRSSVDTLDIPGNLKNVLLLKDLLGN